MENQSTSKQHQSYISALKFVFEMGQQQLSMLQQIQDTPGQEPSTKLPSNFIQKMIEFTQKTANEPATQDQLQALITQFLTSQSQITRKRSRSYELLQSESAHIEQKCESGENQKECQLLQEEMEWVEEMEQEVRSSITEIMVTQKVFKIRQNFRKLILRLLKIENFLIYILHGNGRLEFHDFKNNYITDLLQNDKNKKIESIISSFNPSQFDHTVYEMFSLSQERKDNEQLYKWSAFASGDKYRLCFVWQKQNGESKVNQINKRLIEKIISISTISTLEEEELSLIQNYSKDLLDILQLCIAESEQRACYAINPTLKNLQQIQKQLINSKRQNIDPILGRINAFEQLQYELLQRIRMYKKYVCESDKIFMDFDQSAILTFISCNFSHRISGGLSKLWEKQKLYIQNIFKEDKLINQFMKKAVQQKIKNNKLYELDFETKVRIKYDEEGRITRFHVILEQLDNSSSHSSSNLYCSSSTKILSEDSQKNSQKQTYAPNQKEEEGTNVKEKQVRHSALMKNLQKLNPGIINEGWINLFVKDSQLTRKNTHFKNKGKTYTVKRSYSLNRDAPIQNQESVDSDLKQKLQSINVQSTDLNLLKMDQQLLQPLVNKIFKKLQYFSNDNINKQYFDNFLMELHHGYQTHNNPFHNFTHGVNVMHTCFLLATTPTTKQLFTPFKIFTIVFSGLCHDVGHTGFTNLFQIASHSKKAITYNDSSPLENYHAAYTFELLRKPQNNFIKDLTPEEAKDFRKSVISNILFTDIKEHFPLLKRFNALIKEQAPKNQEYLTVLSAMIVHTSDFGGSAKQFQICKQWSLKVNLEFSNQYKMQGELNLTQTPFMKDLTNISILSKNQGGFLKVIVFPLYEAMDNFNVSDSKARKLRQHVQNNMREWQRIHSQSLKQQNG